MMFVPQPRFQFYGFPLNYGMAAAHPLQSRRDLELVRGAESDLAKFLGTKHAICTPQGRVAIYLALDAMLEPGQSVILSPYTLYDVVNMVIAAGAKPVFADVERRTGNLSVDALTRSLDEHENVGAVIATHLHGIAADVQAIKRVCDTRKIPLLEDTCQALGGHIDGKMLGSFGTVGAFSTGRAKNLNSFLGGFAVTDDARIADHMRQVLADWPVERKRLTNRIAHCLMGDVLTRPPVFQLMTFWIFRRGILNDVEAIQRQFDTEVDPVCRRTLPDNYKRQMSGLQARLISKQLTKVNRNASLRTNHARRYHEGLADIPEITMPPFRDDGRDVYLSYPIQVPDRIELQKFMARQYRDITIQHIGNTANYRAFEEWFVDCPVARTVAESVLLMPTYPGYTSSQVEKNIKVIRDFFGRSN